MRKRILKEMFSYVLNKMILKSGKNRASLFLGGRPDVIIFYIIDAIFENENVFILFSKPFDV